MPRMRWIGSILAGMMCAQVAAGQGAADGVREGPGIVIGRDLGIGRRIEEPPIRDGKALVLYMTSATCPLARKYGPTVSELQAKYRAKGVTFVAVNVSTAEGAQRAETLGARSTTEVFVLDR